MGRISNQDKEKYYFGMFQKDYQLPSGVIIHKDKPDVIVEGERKIGIEITNFFHESGSNPESEQVQNKLREKVISEAHHLYQKRSGRMFEISFGFDKLNPIQKNQNALVDQLIHLSTKIQDHETGQIRRDYFKHIPEISFVYLNNKEFEVTRWRVVRVHDVPMLARDRLLEIIEDKEQRAKKYEKCDAYWLLIVVDFMNPAQDQEIRIDNFKKVDSEEFERIIIYKTLFGHILEAK